jgi:predicted RNA-binding protein
MCQISVIDEREGREKTILENVTRLDVVPDGVVLSTFFEEPMEVSNAVISRIDFLGGKVFLGPSRNRVKKTDRGTDNG